MTDDDRPDEIDPDAQGIVALANKLLNAQEQLHQDWEAAQTTYFLPEHRNTHMVGALMHTIDLLVEAFVEQLRDNLEITDL